MKGMSKIEARAKAVNKMSRNELAREVSKLSNKANKRIDRLRKAGYDVSIDKFGARGKNINQLRSEYMRANSFLDKKTSSLRGRRKIEKEIEARIGGKLEKSKADLFWDVYDRIKESQPEFLQRYGSERMQQFLYQNIEQSDSDMMELINAGLEQIQEWYEEDMEEQENGDFFEFFGL